MEATQAIETVAIFLVVALVNIRGEGTSSGRRGCHFKEFDEHPFPMFDGNLSPTRVKNWLMDLKELFRAMDCIEKQRIMYTAYKFHEEAR